MPSLARSDALALVRRAETTVGFPANPIFGFFYCVSWMWRKVMWIPDMIKRFITTSQHPTAYTAGFLFNLGGMGQECVWIVVAARVASVVRPLIDLSVSCTKVRADAKAVTRSLCGDKQVARVFCQAKGILTKSPFAYPILFCWYVIPAFLKRAQSFIVNSGKVGWHAYDLYEALKADDPDVVARSLAETLEIVKQVGDGRLLQAIDFHKVWLKELLRKYKTNVDLDKVKDTIARIGRGDVNKLFHRTLSDVARIAMEGILDVGRK